MRAVAFVGLAMAPGRTDAYIIKTARHVSFSKCTATSAQQDRDLVVLTLSARHSVALREGIRASWAFGHSNVFFFVGNYGCSIPPAYRQQYTCQSRVGPDGLAVHVARAGDSSTWCNAPARSAGAGRQPRKVHLHGRYADKGWYARAGLNYYPPFHSGASVLLSADVAQLLGHPSVPRPSTVRSYPECFPGLGKPRVRMGCM